VLKNRTAIIRSVKTAKIQYMDAQGRAGGVSFPRTLSTRFWFGVWPKFNTRYE
jgi:hypothetical protein